MDNKIHSLFFLKVKVPLFEEFRKLDYETLLQIKAELLQIIEEKEEDDD